MPRIGIVSQWFDPEGGSAVVPGFIARSLLRRGFEVEVLTSFPNYPHGSIYPGYRQRPYQRERIDGITVHRVPLVPNHGSRALGRVGSYASFAATSSVGMRSLSKCDGLLVYSTPVTAGVGPWIQHLWRRRPVLTLIQDLWPETMQHSGMVESSHGDSLALRAAGRLSNSLYRNSDRIVVISPSMIDRLVGRGIDRDRIDLVYNWVDESLLRRDVPPSPFREAHGLQDSFIAMYAGNLGEPQSAGTMIEAAILLRHRSDIVIVIVGDGTLDESMRARVTGEGLSNVHFLGRRPIDDIPSLMAASDVQIVSLAPSPLFEMTIPSKLQFALGFGKPVIAAVGGDPARLADRSGAALLAAPGNGSSMAAAITRAADMPRPELEGMGQAGRDFYDTELSEASGGDALARILRDMISSSRARAGGHR